MNTFKDEIQMEQKRIQRLIDLTDLPDIAEDSGSLTIEPRGKSSYCYLRWYQHGKRIRKEYLGTPHSEAVRAYVSTRFRSEQLRRLKSNQRHLESLEKHYLDYDRASVTAALPKACQALITDSAFDARYEELRQWANADYPRNPAPFPDTENYAVDGTRTRSKGETIFYNSFIYLGVLFRFDCEMEVIDERGFVHKLCPDFLIQCFDGTLIAIEHLGWSTGLDYGIKFGRKCYYYLREGFILGKNYFVTSDDYYGGTDSQAIMEIAMLVHKKFFGY